MPALLYTLGTFALILVLVRLRAPLAVAVLAGAMAAGALFGLGPVDVIRALAAGAVNARKIKRGSHCIHDGTAAATCTCRTPV
ncbi:MAG: hypothetical protein ISS78_04505 [Phycisphaerae bacterium]|nr:hypothetical protein [Phycisphaerae bacterium]